ncbi:beta-hydroxyacyl-[acyl carrier protein] dehydratase, partial [Candidatus Regiella insecticola 5.15]
GYARSLIKNHDQHSHAINAICFLDRKSILTTTKQDPLDIEEILTLLPHRYPFLLVDRVLEFEKGKSLKALKNVSFNEPFFQGHFPGKPIFPGVLILEAMAQATGILAFKSGLGGLKSGEIFYFTGIDEARFRLPVTPGDQMILEVTFCRTRCGITRFQGVATVDNKIVCEATMTCARNQHKTPGEEDLSVDISGETATYTSEQQKIPREPVSD